MRRGVATLGPDLAIDPTTGDLAMVGGSFYLHTDVRQAVSIAIRFFQGEWFLDRDKGVPYYEQILVKAPNLQHVGALIRAAILAVPGVGALTSFSVDLAGRVLRVTWSATTDAGEIGPFVEEI